jgi:hypothetical protein
LTAAYLGVLGWYRGTRQASRGLSAWRPSCTQSDIHEYKEHDSSNHMFFREVKNGFGMQEPHLGLWESHWKKISREKEDEWVAIVKTYFAVVLVIDFGHLNCALNA